VAAPRGADAHVRFSGPPDLVEALVPVDPSRRRTVRVVLEGYEGEPEQEVRALTAPAGNVTLVRLVLPPTAPPGDSRARVLAGDDEYPALVQVTGRAALAVHPGSLDVVLDGDSAEVMLQVANTGNVPIELPAASGFGLIREGALDTAVGAALTSDQQGLDRVARAADTLADLHAGVVRAQLADEPGALAPGETRLLRVLFALQGELRSDRPYRGTWVLGPVTLLVTVRRGTASDDGGTT
jgi:hypothetical protein